MGEAGKHALRVGFHRAKVKVIFENDYLTDGGTRCGATATAVMLDDYRQREAAEQGGQAAQSTPGKSARAVIESPLPTLESRNRMKERR